MKNLDKEEFRVKLEEINHLVEQKDYKGAMNVVDSIDWRRVKNVRTLCVVGEIYAANKRYEDSKEIFLLAYHRASIGKNILYRLVEVSLKLGQVSEAVEFYQEYREVAPNDNTQYILKYKILKVKKAPLAEQIKVLEDYKEKEFTEKWSYELAKLYYQDGDKEKCLELCNEIILWFNEGNYVMKAMDLKQRMGALTGEEKERYEQQFVPKLLKPEEADTIKEEEKAPEAENQGSESIESIQIKNEDLDGVESLQDKISKGLRDIFGSRKMDEMEDSIVSTEQTKEVQEEMLRDPASEKEYESVPELEPETGKVKVENTKETVAEESVNTADETAEKSAEAVSEENTEGLENADRSESAEEKNAFSTETETPVENLKMPTLNIPDSMKNMVPEEIEVPKAPVQNNLFSDEADAAEKMKDEKPAFDFSNFNLEDTILAAASAQGIEIPDEKVDEEKVQEENKEIVEAAQEISTKPQNAVKEEKAEDIPEEEEVITEDEEEIEPGSEGLVTLPYFAGERTPINDPAARGMVFGLTLNHTRKHLYRSALEGIVFSILQHIEIFREKGIEPTRILAAGGGTKNPVWMQMTADITGILVAVGEETAGACYGDALMAAIGVGHFKGFEELRDIINIKRIYTPDENRTKLYRPYYEMFCRLYEDNKDSLHRLSDLNSGV